MVLKTPSIEIPLLACYDSLELGLGSDERIDMEYSSEWIGPKVLVGRVDAMRSETGFVQQLAPNDGRTAELLLPIVYRELRLLAASRLRRESPGQTLQATALVHEAYLRLVGSGSAPFPWKSRAQFFAAASEAMRRIVIDNHRRKKRIKRGGRVGRLDIALSSLASEQPRVDLLSLDEALNCLEAIDAKKAMLVKLRYFAGMNMAEAADVLDISKPTAERHWRFARAWLADWLTNN